LYYSSITPRRGSWDIRNGVQFLCFPNVLGWRHRNLPVDNIFNLYVQLVVAIPGGGRAEPVGYSGERRSALFRGRIKKRRPVRWFMQREERLFVRHDLFEFNVRQHVRSTLPYGRRPVFAPVAPAISAKEGNHQIRRSHQRLVRFAAPPRGHGRPAPITGRAFRAENRQVREPDYEFHRQRYSSLFRYFAAPPALQK